jgi:hypothetical protein
MRKRQHTNPYQQPGDTLALNICNKRLLALAMTSSSCSVAPTPALATASVEQGMQLSLRRDLQLGGL